MAKIGSVGSSWEDVRKELFTSEEIVESDLRVALIGEMIKVMQLSLIHSCPLRNVQGRGILSGIRISPEECLRPAG